MDCVDRGGGAVNHTGGGESGEGEGRAGTMTEAQRIYGSWGDP